MDLKRADLELARECLERINAENRRIRPTQLCWHPVDQLKPFHVKNEEIRE